MTNIRPIVVTGGFGFLGQHLVRSLTRRGLPVRPLGRKHGDLREVKVAETLLEDADIVVHLAADVGGVGYLKGCPGRAFHDNLLLGLNVIRAASRGRAKRLILAGTPCSYSSSAELPLTEAALLRGVPSGDTGTYGYAKLATSLAAAAFCEDTSTDTVTVIPSNLYGPGDSFDEDHGHVVAALLRKAILAAEYGENTFEVWGDGSATRDFVYVSDVADGIAAVVQHDEPFLGAMFNLGSDRETSIGEIATVIATAVGSGLSPTFLADKPVGYVRRVMSSREAFEQFGYTANTGLLQGLRKTIAWLHQSGHVAKWKAAAKRTHKQNTLRRVA